MNDSSLHLLSSSESADLLEFCAVLRQLVWIRYWESSWGMCNVCSIYCLLLDSWSWTSSSQCTEQQVVSQAASLLTTPITAFTSLGVLYENSTRPLLTPATDMTSRNVQTWTRRRRRHQWEDLLHHSFQHSRHSTTSVTQPSRRCIFWTTPPGPWWRAGGQRFYTVKTPFKKSQPELRWLCLQLIRATREVLCWCYVGVSVSVPAMHYIRQSGPTRWTGGLVFVYVSLSWCGLLGTDYTSGAPDIISESTFYEL